jgi:hypothetical protein
MARVRELRRELMRKLRVSRARRRALKQQIEQRRFEERRARHAAGIYQPPNQGSF